jgi:GTP-binding protein EngB required for normal cell division
MRWHYDGDLMPSTTAPTEGDFGRILDAAAELIERYELSPLNSLLASCRSAQSQAEVSVAVVGRFKAGKSSFLNHLLNRSLLPVGVVPVTAVIVEIRYGPTERATVHFLDGRFQEVPVDRVAPFISERENPANAKGVSIITVELPGLEHYRGLKFVDTPGLESSLAHNTEEALQWLPNVGLALMTVSVDPPLSQQDLELLQRLHRFTPRVTVLLTKVDLLTPEERSEVITFVQERLAQSFDTAPRVIPYSIRPAYEDLKTSLEQEVLQPLLASFGEERRAIIARKIDTLLRECAGFITLNLKSAELLGAEREALKEQLIGQHQVIADIKAQLRLIVRHAASETRTRVERRLETHQRSLESRLLSELAVEFPKWTRSLAFLLDSFDRWLSAELGANLANVSAAERPHLAEPLQQTARQIFRILQDFRDRLSDGTKRAFGVPLKTTEVEIAIQQPGSPDIDIGKIFDRNWELLSPVVPVALIKGVARRHFERQVSYKLVINISRLASQWEERINSALLSMQKEAERRLDELVGTVGKLIESGDSGRLPAIGEDLKKIEALRREISAGTPLQMPRHR